MSEPLTSERGRSARIQRCVYRSFAIALPACAVLIAMLHWGGTMLVADDRLPAHLDAGVVLQGSSAGEAVRLAGAMQLAREGVIGRILVSVPSGLFWGVYVPAAERQYIEHTYGEELSQRTEFCETGSGVNSTGQEATALSDCIRKRGWQSVVIVTSNYHTRRAGMIWRRVSHQQNLSARIYFHGVADPDFHPNNWWRERLSAKTWFFETTKLVWALFER